MPPYLFSRLFPFSPYRLTPSKRQADAEVGPLHLDVQNESIIQLIESVEFKGSSIEVKPNGPISKEILNTNGFQQKIWYVFEKIHSSGIRCIHRNGDETHHYIKIQSEFSENLLFRKWSEFRFKELLECIEKREYAYGKPTWTPNPLRDGLLDGYVLFKMHFFDLAYDVFLKVEEDAKRSGDLALYFLSCRNRDKVSREIYWRIRLGYYSQTLADQMKVESENMDLVDTLKSIKVEKPVLQLLQDIQEETLIKRYGKEIEKNREKILNTFKAYQDPYSRHVGPNYAVNLEWEFDSLCSFLDTNGLALSDETFLEKSAKQTLEGLIASYQTSERYENRYQGFHSHSLLNCIRWVESKYLRSILKEYGLEKFDFATGHKEVFVDSAINFFRSWEDQNNLFGQGRLYRDYLEKNSMFNIAEKKITTNFLAVLSRVVLEDISDRGSRLCDAVLSSSEYIPQYLLDTSVFISFCLKHLHLFNSRQIEKLLDFLAPKRQFRSHYAEGIASRLKEVHPDFRIVNENLFKRLIESNENDKTDRLALLVYLYELLDEHLQDQLKEVLRSHWTHPVNLHGIHLYLDSLLADLKLYNQFPEDVLHGLVSTFPKLDQIQFTVDGEFEPFEHKSSFGGKEWPGNYVLLVSRIAQAQFTGKIDSKTRTKLISRTDLPGSLKWVLNPKKFDYSQFDYFWLFFILDEAQILIKLADLKIPELKAAIQKGLRERYSAKLGAIFFKYFDT